jgi:hypothetical protein
MQWAAAEQHARIVNMSLGGPDDPTVLDPVEEAVQTLSARYGALFVVAAGNADGPTDFAIQSPGTADAALTVGAVDGNERLADFSVRGPRRGDDALKPDITAPGVDITAARGKDATQVPGKPGDPYTTLSGTSMATPHVAGAAAILAQQHPDWSGAKLKAALMASARPNPATGVYGQGAGRVDVASAVRQLVTTDPASLSFGTQLWPHSDDRPVTRTVTYENLGPASVTLNLALSINGPDGKPTPAGMFTVSAATVTVAAGSAATVTVTADTRIPGQVGFLGGWLTATGGDIVMRTALALHSEVESYDVTLIHVGRIAGVPFAFNTRLAAWDGLNTAADRFADGIVSESGEGATATVRLPRGRYTLIAELFGLGSEPDTALLAQPDLDVTQNLALTVDGRRAKPVSLSVRRRSAVALAAEMAVVSRRRVGNESAGEAILGVTFAGMYAGRLGPDRRTDTFLSAVGGQFAEADPTGSTIDSPTAYHLEYPIRGHMIDGYDRKVVDGDLAAVRAGYARTAPGTTAVKRSFPAIADFDVGGFPAFMEFHLPFTRTEFYNTDAGVQWWDDLWELTGTGDFLADSFNPRYLAYRPGRPYHTSWNEGVFGPSFPAASILDEPMARTGDTIVIHPPLHTDGQGRYGFPGGSFTATLYSDGTRLAQIGEQDPPVVDVPAGEAAYRLEVHAAGLPTTELSTVVDVEWTFRSAHVDGDASRPLPLWGVRFTPDLDNTNAVPAGATSVVALTPTPQAGATVGMAGTPGVKVSFDDGATWTSVPVGDGRIRIAVPAGNGFVSLRATLADSDGTRVEQTVIHAFRYGSTATTQPARQ